MTNREIISQIRSMNKLLSSDALMNDRTILKELKTNASLLIKRETSNRRLWQSSELFTNIDCLEMLKVPLAECCEFTSDRTIARSKKKLPKLGEGIFGQLIQQVASVDGLQKFKESTPMRYGNLLKIDIPNPLIFYWIYNDYLYVTNPYTKYVRISAYFEEEVPNDLLFPNCDCKPEGDNCISDLDKKFRCPGYLLQPTKSMTYENLLKVYFNVPTDYNKTSNNNDESSK